MKLKGKLKFGFWVFIFLIILLAVFYFIAPTNLKGNFTTTLDPVHKQILEDSPFPFDDALDDIITLVNNSLGEILAVVSSDYVYVREGMRKEEIAELFASGFDWREKEKLAFATGDEGRYYPGTYALYSNLDQENMKTIMLSRFKQNVQDHYASSTESIIKLDTVLKIASLIEREAGGKADMRLISGIIWNRIFRGMTLDIDATLQYAKGSKESGWWPTVLPADKKIESPYNTYKYKGLPPTPISNPGLSAIDSALRPKKTACLFYLHDKHRRIHCSSTYQEHKKNIAKYYP